MMIISLGLCWLVLVGLASIFIDWVPGTRQDLYWAEQDLDFVDDMEALSFRLAKLQIHPVREIQQRRMHPSRSDSEQSLSKILEVW